MFRCARTAAQMPGRDPSWTCNKKHSGPVNIYPVAALLCKIFSGKARGEKFGQSK
jgi:hypothetical protein